MTFDLRMSLSLFGLVIFFAVAGQVALTAVLYACFVDTGRL